jgi:hypothetical protein
MKERIKLLAEQASHQSPDGYPVTIPYSKDFAEKFAELIVADCIALADKYAAGGAGSEFDVGYISCAETLSQEMKQQFGVEE